MYRQIEDSLRRLYLQDDRPWLICLSDDMLKKMARRELLQPANPHFPPDPQCPEWYRHRHKFAGD